MIVISHDREFLDAVTKVTLHLDDASSSPATAATTAPSRRCAPSAWSSSRRLRASSRSSIAHLQKFIDRFKAKASKAKQAQSRVKALARMEKLAPVLTGADFAFEFREPQNLPNPMLAIRRRRLRLSSANGERKLIVDGIDRSVWPASASASSAPTARASRRWSRPSRARCRRWPARSPKARA